MSLVRKRAWSATRQAPAGSWAEWEGARVSPLSAGRAARAADRMELAGLGQGSPGMLSGGENVSPSHCAWHGPCAMDPGPSPRTSQARE